MLSLEKKECSHHLHSLFGVGTVLGFERDLKVSLPSTADHEMHHGNGDEEEI
jgi:hypothetical protein